MRKSLIRLGLVNGASALLVISSAPALAHGLAEHSGDSSREHARKSSSQMAEERKTQQETKTSEAKLRSCHNRERAINNILKRMANRGTKHIEVINKIAQRVQAFYVKSGKTVSNYDALVADVNAKAAAAQAAVDQLKSSSVSFKCDGSDPKGAAKIFQENLRKEKAAIKAYKTAVRNLIVAVKSAQANSEGGQ